MSNNILEMLGLGGGGQTAEPTYADAPALAAKAQRAKQIAEALRQSGQFQEQSQMVGGRVVPVGIGQALGKVAQSYVAGQKDQEAQRGMAQVQGLQQKDLASALEKFQAMGALDPQAAAQQALMSQHPQMQKLGQDMITENTKGRMFGTKPIVAEDGTLIVSNPNGEVKSLAGYKGAPTGKFSVRPVAENGMWQNYVVDARGNLTDKKEGSPYAKGAGASETNFNMGDKANLQAVGDLSKATSPGGKGYEAAEGARKGLMSAAESVASIEQGAKSGIEVPAVQTLRKLGEAAGIPNASTAPTDALSANLKSTVFNSLGGLGNQISDADRSFVTGSIGDLTTNPMALKRLLALQIASGMMTVEKHNKQVDALGTEVSPALLEGNKLAFSIGMNDPEIQKMVDNVLRGQPTVSGGTANPPPPQPPKQIKSDADYNALPAGATYIAPDGSTRRKGG